MSDKRWYGGGIYSITPRRGPCKGTEIFYGKVWIKSERRRRHFLLGPGFLQAKKKLASIYADPEKALLERARKNVRILTFEELVEEFQANYRSRGGTSYYGLAGEDEPKGILTAPLEYFGKRPITEITVPEVDRYLARRRDEKTKGVPRVINKVKVMVGAGRRRISESTIRKELIAIGTVFRWAERRGLVGRNPIAKVEKPKEPGRESIAVVDAGQEEKLLGACPPWVADVVEWALYSGMRRGEVITLRWRDVDRARGIVHVLGTKTGKVRQVPLALSARLEAILDRHPRRTDTELVFREQDGKALDIDTLNGLLEAAAKSAGIPKDRGVLWNRLRHTWATRLAAKGVSLFKIAKRMGNSVPICEKHYAAYLPDADDELDGVLDPAPAEPTPEKDSKKEIVGDQVTPEGTAVA